MALVLAPWALSLCLTVMVMSDRPGRRLAAAIAHLLILWIVSGLR